MFTAPIRRAVVVDPIEERDHRLLVGQRHRELADAERARAAQRVGEPLGGHVEGDVARVDAERAKRGLVHRRRARVAGRVEHDAAERGEGGGDGRGRHAARAYRTYMHLAVLARARASAAKAAGSSPRPQRRVSMGERVDASCGERVDGVLEVVLLVGEHEVEGRLAAAGRGAAGTASGPKQTPATTTRPRKRHARRARARSAPARRPPRSRRAAPSGQVSRERGVERPRAPTTALAPSASARRAPRRRALADHHLPRAEVARPEQRAEPDRPGAEHEAAVAAPHPARRARRAAPPRAARPARPPRRRRRPAGAASRAPRRRRTRRTRRARAPSPSARCVAQYAPSPLRQRRQ